MFRQLSGDFISKLNSWDEEKCGSADSLYITMSTYQRLLDDDVKSVPILMEKENIKFPPPTLLAPATHDFTAGVYIVFMLQRQAACGGETYLAEAFSAFSERLMDASQNGETLLEKELDAEQAVLEELIQKEKANVRQ